MNSIIKKYLIAFACLFLVTAAFATSSEPYPFTSQEKAQRFNTLTKQVRCVVCQAQSIADSNSPIAAGLRQKVYRMVRDDKTNQEIKDYLVKRYGEKILLSPRFSQQTLILWLFPLAALCIAGLIIWRQFSKQKNH